MKQAKRFLYCTRPSLLRVERGTSFTSVLFFHNIYGVRYMSKILRKRIMSYRKRDEFFLSKRSAISRTSSKQTACDDLDTPNPHQTHRPPAQTESSHRLKRDSDT